MKRLLFILACCLGLGQGLRAQCYLEIENPGAYETAAITQISQAHISRYFTPISDIPPAGIGQEACLYKLSLTEVSNGILVTIKGPDVSAYGDSRLRGIDGFKQALFRAIISSKPEHRESICRQHYDRTILEKDCAGIAVDPDKKLPEKGRLVVRVPREYRYAALYGDDTLIGEMSGEIVREFEIETGRSIVFRVEDGGFVSEKILVMANPGVVAKIEFQTFERRLTAAQPSAKTNQETEPTAKKDFGEDSPLFFGLGGGNYSFTSKQDQYRLNGDKIQNALAMELFFEYYPTLNLGFGLKFRGLSAEREASTSTVKEKMNLSQMLATLNLWFPLNTRNRGFSHFGLTGGIGPANYNVTVSGDTISDDGNEWETNGIVTSYGAFFDWGGDLFGARLTYTVNETNYATLKNKTYPQTSPEYEVDASGTAWVFSIRWAF